MNQFIFEGKTDGVFKGWLDNRQKSIAEGWLILPPKREGGTSQRLNVIAYGKTAEQLLTVSNGQPLRLEGGINIQRDTPTCINVDRAHILRDLPEDFLSRAFIIGRAGRDPEARYLESGNVVANFTLAVNRRSRDDKPDWFNLEIWGKQAQVAADYVRKGSHLGIYGSFRIDCWTDRTTGEERSKPVILVDQLDLLGSRQDAERQQQQATATGGPL